MLKVIQRNYYFYKLIYVGNLRLVYDVRIFQSYNIDFYINKYIIRRIVWYGIVWNEEFCICFYEWKSIIFFRSICLFDGLQYGDGYFIDVFDGFVCCFIYGYFLVFLYVGRYVGLFFFQLEYRYYVIIWNVRLKDVRNKVFNGNFYFFSFIFCFRGFGRGSVLVFIGLIFVDIRFVRIGKEIYGLFIIILLLLIVY